MRLITAFLFVLLFFTLASQGQGWTEYISKIKQTPELSIPEEARKSGLGGEIYVRVNLDADGNVVSVESVAGPGPICRNVTRPEVVALRKAARDAAKLAKFEPVIEDGQRKLASGAVRFVVPADKPEQPVVDDRIIDLGHLHHAGPDGSENFLKRTGIKMPKPVSPPAARAVRAAGPVSIKVLIDESGDVFSAEAVSGHPLLRASAVEAGCKAKFRPTLLGGDPVKIAGLITYVFAP